VPLHQGWDREERATTRGAESACVDGAIKLKGCRTICKEDLRRVEGMYPNQYGRLLDELLLSSGWRRISEDCHFSNKAVPDRVPLFPSIARGHPSERYNFFVAASAGMAYPLDVDPLCWDHLVVLEMDYPSACEPAPPLLLLDPSWWCLVDGFRFFHVYYKADFDGGIYILVFPSPSLTAE